MWLRCSRRHQDAVERIVRHCGFWESPIRKLTIARAPLQGSQRAPDQARDLELVPDPEFRESECREAQAEASRELQLVLDPELL